MHSRLAWFTCLLVFGFAASARSTSKADLVITNAHVITVNPRQNQAEAVAIRGNKIISVGSNQEIIPLISPATRIINADGKTVMPGIYDSHVHSYRAAVSELGGGAPLIHSIKEAQDWIRAQASKRPEGSWIILERVYASRLKEQRLPTRKELDEAAPNNPVHWNSGPVSVANTKALEVSGITRETPDPLPGEIVKNPETGEPTGLLRNAAHLLKGAISAYRPTPEEHRAALKRLHSLYNQQGITSIGERRAEPDAIDLFRDLARSGELTVRMNCTRVLEPSPRDINEALQKLKSLTNAAPGKLSYGPTGVGDDWVRIGPLKVFLDGGMLIGTA
ncbi:MAG: amidohydrolase, partial [Limisphaerales bacterium]